LKRQIGDARQQRALRQGEPRAAAGLRERRGERFPDQHALIRVGDALVIALGDAEPARLIKKVLRVGELGEVGARLDHRPVTGGGPGVEEIQRVGVPAVFKKVSAKGGEAVGHGARRENVRREAHDLIASGVAEERAQAERRSDVGADNGHAAANPGVEQRAVEDRATNAAQAVGRAFGERHGLRGKGEIRRDAAVHNGPGTGEVARGEHHHEPTVARGADGRGLSKDAFAARVGAGAAGRQVA